jgi:hypothetical protein
MKVFDFKLDDSFDLVFDADGDFVETESTTQHQQLLLLTEKGEWDGAPTVGIGAINWLMDERPGDLVSEIRGQYERDGMRVGKLRFMSPQNFEIQAEY